MAEQENKKTNKQKSAMREWWDSVLFAVVAATLIRGLFLEAYTIPTGSMEKSLLFPNLGFKETGTSVPLNIVRDLETKELKTVLKTASGFGGGNASLILQKQP